MDIYLDRFAYNPWGCFGDMTVGGFKFAAVMPPWVANASFPAGVSGKSTIADGDFSLKKHTSPSHPDCYVMVNPSLGVYHYDADVPPSQKAWARTVCLIHNANFARQLEGCIALGMSFGVIQDLAGDKAYHDAVVNSEAALTKFMSLLEGQTNISLHIRPALGAVFMGSRVLN